VWIDSTVENVLSRETQNGVLNIGGAVNEMPELRIVSKRTFEKAQEKEENLRTPDKTRGPFDGGWGFLSQLRHGALWGDEILSRVRNEADGLKNSSRKSTNKSIEKRV